MCIGAYPLIMYVSGVSLPVYVGQHIYDNDPSSVHLSVCVCVCVCLQPGLTSAQEEWGMGRHRHMHDINSLRCQRQPVYGRDLVHTILSLCRQQDRRPSQPSSSSPATANEGVWLWTGSLACERVMTGVRPEDGGSGSLALSKALLSYHTRAHVMEDTIRR